MFEHRDSDGSAKRKREIREQDRSEHYRTDESVIGTHAGFMITWENSATLHIVRPAKLLLNGIFERKAAY